MSEIGALSRGSGTDRRIWEPGSKLPSHTCSRSATSSNVRLANGMVSIGTRTCVPRRCIDGRPSASAIISMRVRQCKPRSASSSDIRSMGTSTSTWPSLAICSATDVTFHFSCPASDTCTKSAPPTPPPMARGPANDHIGSVRSSLASSTSTTSPVQKRSSRSCGSSNATRTSSPGNANRTNTTRPSI